DDTELCELALTATAAQLATTIAGYRTAAGSRLKQERDRGLTWTTRESGTVDIRVRLPAEDAAILLAALNAAKEQYGAPPPTDTKAKTDATDTTPAYTSADALLDIARVFTHTAPEDRSGEDRTLVVVQVHADQLTSTEEHVPAGTPDTEQPDTEQPDTEQPDTGQPDTETTGNVPAGTSHTPGQAPNPTCHLQGVGGIEPDTARKLACDSDLLGAILDRHRGVLALGHTRRLVTRALRRALMIRDQGRSQFTGCHQTHHLKAHHLIHWADGGPTDLDNLILLCQFHHTAVHEGNMTIRRTPAIPSTAPTWEFVMPDGKPHRDWYTGAGLLNFLTQHGDRTRAEHQHRQSATMITNVTGFHHPDAQRIQPRWRGERYDRHEAVQALFRMPVASESPKAA
ncbi:MAG TPA: DUF222 domain-containing protein, partial [Microlunatus sp.]